MIRVTRHGKVLHIETNNGEMWIPEELVRDSKCRLEMRILYDLADYLEKPPAAAAVYDSPMAKMAAALRTKAADEQADFNRRVQSGEWGPMLDAGTQADFCKNCDGSGWDGQSRETVCPTCSGGGIAARQPVGHGWSGWATQKPGSMPKLWGTTPAAPGIDLEQFRPLMQLSMTWGPGSKYRIAAESLADLIDASPKGDIDPLCAAKRPGCNYPACGCADASPKGGSDACIWTDDGEGNWATACGEIFTLIEGVPAENKVHHCPYCGKNLQATSAEVGA